MSPKKISWIKKTECMEEEKQLKNEPDTLLDEDFECCVDDVYESGTAEYSAASDGERLDVFAAEASGLTRSCIQRLIETGNIVVNGKNKKANYRTKAGDIVRVNIPQAEPTGITAEDIPLDIVYQDEDIAVINKPVGMVVHPAAGNKNGTLVNALMFHLKDLSGIGGELRPGIVHRIDKNTSGLLVIAKNDTAHRFLSNELKTHSVSRVYLALCEGNFKEDSGTINAPIGRHPRERKKMAIVSDGREAVTHWKVLERFGNMTLLSIELETGRTHQIRVHMQSIKHPLVGDDVYSSGRNSLGFCGQALHAEKLRLVHPRTGEIMTFEAEPPLTFKKAIEKLRAERQLNQ